MRSLLAAILCVSSGCVFIFDRDDDDDLCTFNETKGAPEIARAPLRDPGDLTCDAFNTGGCNPGCPCPERTEPAFAPSQPVPPIPTWPICGHTCESLGEGACSADPRCRVVKHAACAIGPSSCLTDFLGCFPIDEAPDASVDCRTADAWDCSRSAACTAYHSYDPSEDCDLDGECRRPFELCMPEGQAPGDCYGSVTCRALPPACRAGTVPGVAGGCYTGACIPQHLCNPQP